GPTALSQQWPEWLSSGTPPKIMRSGYIITTEMDVKYARYHAQAQLCVALNPVDKLHEECFRVARESIEGAFGALRPGNKFVQVAEAAEAPLKEAHAWHPGPLVHSMNPQILRTPHSMDYTKGSPREEMGGDKSASYFTWTRGADVVLQKNMVFEVEPVVCLQDHRVLVGGTVVIEDNGPRLLNHIAFEMQRV
ncbi:MAG TPA: M24 family metallopeptidase, partial [Nitrososphaerales archaeon]|nr:M24 family metallopeptidase [Nitrososphaerales archaeon]